LLGRSFKSRRVVYDQNQRGFLVFRKETLLSLLIAAFSEIVWEEVSMYSCSGPVGAPMSRSGIAASIPRGTVMKTDMRPSMV
jgi:hypothetical protein